MLLLQPKLKKKFHLFHLFKYILLIMLLQLSLSTRHPHSLSRSPPLSSCPWIMHISFLASPFPILFLTSSCLFCTYRFVLRNPCTFSPSSPFSLPNDKPPNDLDLVYEAKNQINIWNTRKNKAFNQNNKNCF